MLVIFVPFPRYIQAYHSRESLRIFFLDGGITKRILNRLLQSMFSDRLLSPLKRIALD